MTIVEFLLEQIAEDEADAMSGWRWKALPVGEYDHLQARVLAECEAKRRMVELHDIDDCYVYGQPCDDLRLLALPYAAHPDYDPAWSADRTGV